MAADGARAGGSVAVVLVASPLPQLDRELEYRIPPHLLGRVGAGMRVRVPVRSSRRVLDGFVLRVADEATFEGSLAELDDLVSEAPVLTPPIARLARAVADRQAGVAADVLRLAIPTRQARVEAAWLERRAGAGENARDAVDPDVSDRARAALASTFGAEAAAQLTDAAGARIALRPPVGVDGRVPRAIRALAEIAAAHVADGRGAIVAVPDFRDVELALEALGDLLPPDRVLRADAGAKPAARYRDHLAALDGPAAVVGTRSAVFSPVEPLGAILVLDDGDESFIEPLAPYAHTREVALERQRHASCTLVLAAHASSLEAQRLVELRWLHEVQALGRPPRVLPTTAVLGDDTAARGARIPSVAWRTASEALADGPVLVQVARAGYVPRVACATCREAARCRHCGGPLRLDARGGVPRCGVCGRAAGDWRCPACGGERLRAVSIGATRTADELGRAFPGVPVVLADGETRRVRVPDTPALVVATRGAEPVAEGGYRAVLLLDGERMLARESLDAGVDTLRWWSNAAALAADGAPVVLVGADEGPGRALHAWKLPEAASAELAARRELAFPPAVRVGTVRGSSVEVERAVAGVREIELVRVDGPVPDAAGQEVDGVAADRFIATLRFGYAAGEAVARALKAELVHAATARRPARGGRPGGRASTLRVRLDEPGRF